ncbi:MAG: chromosomal replication initiator protein [Candidatus Berkelbacteria bacterium Licking1014_85]|uniref:Chromosomal replication initiator protein DnaA n=1 Tax=Candidatus Berkelbacteria bacterium Licking1014_85 TaxID=2017148 RepID=A0A554LFN9_9BACT|nr:MAG: chromosomal replication initiator protein [Candidatus Berkelbacteria bacterium Licking1014_85]
MNHDLAQIWQNSLAEFETTVSKGNFNMLFKQSSIGKIENTEITLNVTSNFIRDWLKDKYHAQVLKTLKKFVPEIKELKYFITDKSPKIQAGSVLDKEKSKLQLFNNNSSVSTLNPDYLLESFVIGPSNRLAFATCQAVSQNPGKDHNPLFIYSGVGLGKTHLMHAVGNEILKNNPHKTILYVSCENFANEYINSIKTNKMDYFKKKYRQADIFLIDDIQFLSKKEGTQEEFFHTFNALHQTHRQIIMTSDRVPKAIPDLEERLSSRMSCGMIVDIGQPDFETRLAILERKTEITKKPIEPAVLEYIAHTIFSNIRELEGAFIKVVTDAHLLKIPITLDSAKISLKHLIEEKDKKARFSKSFLPDSCQSDGWKRSHHNYARRQSD